MHTRNVPDSQEEKSLGSLTIPSLPPPKADTLSDTSCKDQCDDVRIKTRIHTSLQYYRYNIICLFPLSSDLLNKRYSCPGNRAIHNIITMLKRSRQNSGIARGRRHIEMRPVVSPIINYDIILDNITLCGWTHYRKSRLVWRVGPVVWWKYFQTKRRSLCRRRSSRVGCVG